MQIHKTKVFSLSLTLFIYFLFVNSVSLAGNGIEGEIQPYATQLRKGISIIAETKTDIKEDLPKAKKVSKTNGKGVFTFRNLIPGKTYTIRVNDRKYISKSIYVTAPEKGTRIAKEPLLYTLLPPKSGTWFYDSKSSKFISIFESNNPIHIRSHDKLGGSGGLGRSNLSAFSVESKDIFNPFTARIKGYIFCFNSKIKDLARLYKISKPGISSIPEGYYYNIKDFIGSQYKAVYEKPRVAHKISIKDRGLSVFAFSLSNLDRGLYIITTDVERQHMSRILGGERAPREGYLLYVTEGDEYTANLYLNSGNYDSAIKIFNDLLRRKPKDLMLLEGLFRAYSASTKKYPQAIRVAEKLAVLNPSSYLYYELGELNNKVGDRAKAIDCYKKSLILNVSDEKSKTKLTELLNKPINTIIQEDKKLKIAFYKDDFTGNKKQGVPIHLQPHKIAAYITYSFEGKRSDTVKVYPVRHASFILENEKDGSDFKVPADWKSYWYEKPGRYFIKGDDVEQTIFFTVNPLQIEFVDKDLNEFLGNYLTEKYGKGIKLHLKPHKIAAYITYSFEGKRSDTVKVYPVRHASFILENEKDGSDFKVPADWKSYWYEKPGRYFIKGGDVEQIIYLTVDPSQIEIVD